MNTSTFLCRALGATRRSRASAIVGGVLLAALMVNVVTHMARQGG